MEVRAVTEDELPQLVRVVEAVAFGQHGRADAGALSVSTRMLELERTRGAFEDGRLVGGSAAMSWELTVPGPVAIPAAAVTWVGVLPTHRRRGILSAMMGALLDDARERGEPVAVLLASESVIYGRFGYGLAVTNSAVEIDRRQVVPGPGWPERGRVRILDDDEAGTVLPAAFERYWAQQPGEVRRSAKWWEEHLADPEYLRDGASAFFHVVHESPAGEVNGYVTYRLDQGQMNTDPLAAFTLIVFDLVAENPQARAALWRFCLEVDLVSTVKVLACPVDEPLRWMLADPRRLRVTRYSDWLWVRLLDIPAALSARAYAADDRLVLEVTGEGAFVIDGGECKPTDEDPSLTMSLADLGAAYLGGVRFTTLAHAGRVLENAPGALARADAMFACNPAPFCATEF